MTLVRRESLTFLHLYLFDRRLLDLSMCGTNQNIMWPGCYSGLMIIARGFHLEAFTWVRVVL